MAIENVTQEEDKFVSFMTACDEGHMRPGQGAVPGVVIHPEADPVNLWCIAEARLATLDKMMAMFACAGTTQEQFSLSDVTDVIRPRVQEVLTLVSTANDRATLDRFTSRKLNAAFRKA
jgi:hypothetical protein